MAGRADAEGKSAHSHSLEMEREVEARVGKL